MEILQGNRADGVRQAAFKVANAEIAAVGGRLTDSFGDSSTTWHFLCECGRAECVERLSMDLGDYRGVRELPDHFVVAEGHVDPGHDTVVRRGDGFAVVSLSV